MIDALLRLFGIQPGSYRVLVRAFWRMSMRQPTSLVAQQVGKTEGAMWKAWLLYGFFGLVVAFLALLGVPRPIFAAIVASSATFLIGMAVVADFAVLVMAPGDDEILFHRPIRSETYLAARLTVAGLHVAILACFYGLFPAIFSLKWGNVLYPPLLLLALAATALFAMLLAFAVYRAGLRLLGGPRLEGLLTYLPALFSIMTFLLPQALIGSLRGDEATRLEPLLNYLPPAWFTAVPEVLLGARDPNTLLRAALGVLVLPLGYWFLIAAMGRGFLQDLLALTSGRGTSTSARAFGRSRLPGALLAPRDSEAAAGYLLYVGALRSRGARARAAPILLMPIAFLLLGLLRGAEDRFGGILAIYLLGTGAGTLVAMAVWHENHQAAWFYGATPLQSYGRFLGGVIRALLERQVLPVFLLLFVIVLWRSPTPTTFGGALHAFAGGCLSLPLLTRFQKYPPFSREFQQSEQTAQMGIYLLSMSLVAVVGAVHFAVATYIPWAFAVTVPLLLAIDVGWLRRVLEAFDRNPPVPIGGP